MWNKQLWYNFLENNSARHHEPKAFLENILEELGYDFCSKYSFNDLRTELGGKPIFDFAILDNSGKVIRLIEFDGEQHYEKNIKNSGWNTYQKYQYTLEHDLLKNKLAQDNDVSLVRIPYWERDNITFEMLFSNKYQI